MLAVVLVFVSLYGYKKIKKAYKPTVFSYYKVLSEEKQNLNLASKSQLKQDIFVYLESNRKNNGFFVEFGATDGVSLSNSYMLEKDFGWKGILAEPAKIWHESLKNNRPNSQIETLCVWKTSGDTLIFNQTDAAELSTIQSYSDSDNHSEVRKKGLTFEVRTISLFDLLKKYNAPQVIDYLSIDTEGSELDILEQFFQNNKYYVIKIITCEHNHTKNREKIYELLTKYGYKRVLKDVSAWDDFYVLNNK